MNCAGSQIPTTIFDDHLQPNVAAAAQPTDGKSEGDGKVSNKPEEHAEPVADGKDKDKDKEQNGKESQGNTRAGKFRKGLRKFWNRLMEEENQEDNQ